MDVLDLHRGVIDENADCESKSAQSHDVYGLAERAQDDNRTQDRQWDGGGDDERRAPVAQEKQDHQRGEAGSNYAFT